MLSFNSSSSTHSNDEIQHGTEDGEDSTCSAGEHDVLAYDGGLNMASG